MNKEGEYRILLSVEFSRTDISEDIVPYWVNYQMKRRSPFGMLTAEASIDLRSFRNKGVEHVDGEMFLSLSKRLNEQENYLLVEGAANTDFGRLRGLAKVTR